MSIISQFSKTFIFHGPSNICDKTGRGENKAKIISSLKCKEEGAS
jgi:hypothetical protein